MEKITTTTKQQRKMGLENWFSRYFGQSSRPSSGDLPAFLVHFFVFHLACVQPLALLKRKKKNDFFLEESRRLYTSCFLLSRRIYSETIA